MIISLTLDESMLPWDGKDAPKFLIDALKIDPHFFVLAADEICAVTEHGRFTEVR